jgi:cation diffusion facilitator CzcD-associated flavoprotein CzcO
MTQPSGTAVAIIGAGPYGVSIAAHLQSKNIEYRIFGKPMDRWRRQMPKGMFLKSEGCASSLSDPHGRYTLAEYCKNRGVPYRDWGTPVPLEVFTHYALSFQQHLVPSVEETLVSEVEQLNGSFELRLADGTALRATRIIVATGLDHTVYIPEVLAGLPPELLSHSSEHRDLSRFRGQEVIVIGAGQSALESAALLSEQGAFVRVLAREASLAWNSVPKSGPRSLYERVRYPISPMGAGMELWFHCNAPMLFRYLPQKIRFEKVRTVQGPAGAWWLRNRVIGHVQVLSGQSVQRAEHHNGTAVLQVAGQDGQSLHLRANHVIAATGYHYDLYRLPFLGQRLKLQVRSEQQRPVLSADFESSVPGLYFTGFASANNFGPVMRFLQGADYTARRISHHIARRWQPHGQSRGVQSSQAPKIQNL